MRKHYLYTFAFLTLVCLGMMLAVAFKGLDGPTGGFGVLAGLGGIATAFSSTWDD